MPMQKLWWVCYLTPVPTRRVVRICESESLARRLAADLAPDVSDLTCSPLPESVRAPDAWRIETEYHYRTYGAAGDPRWTWT